MQSVSVFISAYSLMSISIDRYISIIYPLRPRISRRQAWYMIGAVWLMALVTCLPIGYYSDVVIPGWQEL